MKKFTESINTDDENDFSIESAQAKLRNKLGPFWTLSELISNSERFEKLLSTEGEES